ncbi:MAG TPA: hypothetical protein DCL54_09135 [Alphaproteobacteria bacterium]|nr:hypothetical protein [Alphaproteobacteria bacterium]
MPRLLAWTVPRSHNRAREKAPMQWCDCAPAACVTNQPLQSGPAKGMYSALRDAELWPSG